MRNVRRPSWMRVVRAPSLAVIALLLLVNSAQARDPLTAIDSALPLPNGVKMVALQGVWEERPVHSDLIAGDESLSIPRLSMAFGMGDWAEFTFTYDLLQNLQEGPRSLLGGGSPRLSQKFRFAEQSGLAPSLGARVGFKWPAANEPFEVDSGDFALAFLASWRLNGGWSIDFNTGPAIYGDRFDAGSQNHTWVWNFSAAHVWEKIGLTLKQELLQDSQLASRWFEFWRSESGPFARLETATSIAWNLRPDLRLTARYERSLIHTGIRQGFAGGMEWTF